MRKILVFLLFIIIFSPIALADDLDATELPSAGWDSYNKTIDNAFDRQKPVTDDLFNKTISDMKARNSKKGGWFWNKKKDEIVPLSPIPFKPDTYDNNEMQSVYNKIENTPTIMIPTTVVTDKGVTLSPGFYKLSNKKEADNSYSLILTQGTTLMASISTKHTDEDYEQKEINFYNVIPISDKYLKIIYGTLDLNLEALLEIKN